MLASASACAFFGVSFEIRTALPVGPGLDTSAERRAAISFLDPDFQGLLDAKEVPELVQASLAMVNIRGIHRLAVMEDTRAEMRAFCRAHLGLADDSAVVKANIAAVLEVWEAAKQRLDRQNVVDAQAVSAHLPKQVQLNEMQQLRKRTEELVGKIEDRLVPSKMSAEDLFEQVDGGELRIMTLKEFATKSDAEQTETWNDLVVSKHTGSVKMKKTGVENSMPKTKEELRRRLKLVENHFWYLKFRYPQRSVFQSLSLQTFSKHVQYILGEQVAEFVSKGPNDVVVSEPALSWS